MGQVQTIVPPTQNVEWDDLNSASAMVPQNQVRDIAFPENQNPNAWLYTSSARRISIDNETRQGFINRANGALFTEIYCQLMIAEPLYSHKNPNPNNPQEAHKAMHEAPTEWCETRNNHQTSTMGYPCARCPAMADCKNGWKIELKMVFDDGEGPNEYLLTIPKASATRFRHTATALWNTHKLGIEQVVWLARVEIDRNTTTNQVYPVATFTPLTPDMQPIELNVQRPQPTQRAAVAPQRATPQIAGSAPRADAPSPFPPNMSKVQIPSVEGRAPQAQAAAPVAQRGAASFSTASITPDTGDAGTAYPALLQMIAQYKTNTARQFTEADLKRYTGFAAASLSAAGLKDQELRHRFVRDHFPDETMDGSPTELKQAQILALRDWAQRQDAKEYIAGYLEDADPGA